MSGDISDLAFFMIDRAIKGVVESEVDLVVYAEVGRMAKRMTRVEFTLEVYEKVRKEFEAQATILNQ